MLTPRPGYADPAAGGGSGGSSSSTAKVPDPGALPIPSAPLTGPSTTGQTGVPGAPVTGPFASQIIAKFATLEATGEQLKQAGIDLDSSRQTANDLYQVWQTAITTAAELRKKADSTAAQAYEDAAGLGPFANYATDVHQLGMLAPGFGDGSRGGPAGSETAAQDAVNAQRQAETDEQAYRSALLHEQSAQDRQGTLQASYNQKSAELTALRTTNQTQVDAAEAAQATADRQLDLQFAAGTQVNGKVANPKALDALRFAYAQIGKMYRFGAEGPNYFDCSGLTWSSYRSTGYQLPRVANDQYHATAGSRVNPTQLLPGDLLFFSTTSQTDWTTVSHVAMYVGDNQMIEAAHEGTPVRVNQVWWSAFFAATRVYPAVTPRPAAPPSKPTKSPSPPASKPPTSGPPSTPPTTPPSSTPPSTTPPTTTPPTTTPPTTAPPSTTQSPSTGASSQSTSAPPDPGAGSGSPSAG